MAHETEGKDIGGMDAPVTETTVGLEEARKVIGDLVIRVGFGGERIEITRFGRRVAGLVSSRDMDRLRALDDAAA